MVGGMCPTTATGPPRPRERVLVAAGVRSLLLIAGCRGDDADAPTTRAQSLGHGDAYPRFVSG